MKKWNKKFQKNQSLYFNKSGTKSSKNCDVYKYIKDILWNFLFRVSGTNCSEKYSETEQKVSRLLQEIDGVGKAEVMICETEDGVQSVVVVCEGANDISIVMDVREAVAAALGTEEKAVKVYLKKE